MSRRRLIENVGRLVQTPISRIPWIAGRYLRAIGWFSKALPDGRSKHRIGNALRWVDWKRVALPPSSVELAPGISVKLVPHANEFDFAALLFRRLPYESGVFDWLAGREYDTIIEIGANVGVFTLFFTRRYPRASIYAFEPSAEAYGRLLTNMALNEGAVNVGRHATAFNCAVSDSTTFVDFFEPAGHLTNGSLDASFAGQFSETVVKRKVLAIDAQSLAPLFSGRTLVKIDVEGAEPRILKAMAGLLRERRPDLLIEVLESTEAALNQLDFLVGGAYSPLPSGRGRSSGEESFSGRSVSRLRARSIFLAPGGGRLRFLRDRFLRHRFHRHRLFHRNIAQHPGRQFDGVFQLIGHLIGLEAAADDVGRDQNDQFGARVAGGGAAKQHADEGNITQQRNAVGSDRLGVLNDST
jgi:FkbM family methyltransferase